MTFRSLLNSTLLCFSLALIALFTGCASIVAKSDQQLVFNSQPTKADVYIDGVKRGTTPCNILVQRRRPPPAVVLKKEGYEDTTVVFTSKYNLWIFGNLLSGWCSTTGFLVDMNNNKSVMYWPDSHLVTLPQLEGTTPAQKTDVEQQKHKSKIVRFVATNYDALVLELSKGSGDHLTALFDLMEIPASNRENAVAKIKPLYIKYDDPVELGRAIELEFPR